MPLYKLVTTIETVMYVEGNDPPTLLTRRGALREDCLDGGAIDNAHIMARPIKSADDLPRDWAHSIPFGDGADDRTCAEILAAESGSVAAEED